MTNIKPYIRQLGNVKVDSDESGLISAWDMQSQSGQVLDLAGSNDGTIVGMLHDQYTSLGKGLHFNAASELSIGNDSSLEVVSGSITLSFWCRFDDISVIRSLISKGSSATNQNYFVRINAGAVQFYFRNVGNTSNVTYTTSDTPISVGRWYHIAVAHTFGDGSLTRIYVNGVNRPGTWASGTGDELPLVVASFGFIGSRNATLYHAGDIASAKFFNVHQGQAWVDAEYAKGRTSLWKTAYGANISAAAVTGGEIENTPFRVESGSHQISSYAIGSLAGKAIECVTAGLVSIRAGHFHPESIDNAFGRYDFWIEKASGHTTKIGLVNQLRDNTASGYGFQILTDGTTTIEEWGVGSVVAGGSLTPGTLTKLSLTRRAFDGQFEGFVNSVTFGTGIDTTVTESYYAVFELGVGDKIVYADEQGGHAFTKELVA
jgi:hypothetical protein